MSRLKLRDLDKFGVITDVDPFDLPPGAWSMGINVRFTDGRVQTAPVWRALGTLAGIDPRFLHVSNVSNSNSSVFVGYLDGKVTAWTPSSEIDISITGYTPSSVEAIWTGCTLAQVTYINREDRPLWALRPSDSHFVSVTGWNAGWRAKVVRSYAGAVLALNITKDGVRYPTMVKTSDIVTDPGVMPGSWDHTSPTTNATENMLTEMNGEIIDAQILGSSVVLYSNSEAWLMNATSGDDVYEYRKLPFSDGAINTNCVVEVNGLHYVFGSSDLWAHDGQSPISIADGRVRKFVFKNLNAKSANKFFVTYNPTLNEVSFNFVSSDAYVGFTRNGCNRKAVYNLSNKTWVFDDAPLVMASGYALAAAVSGTWDTTPATWATIGGAWSDLEDGFKRSSIYVGESDTASGLVAHMYANDLYGADGSLSAPVDPIASRGAFLRRDGIDLDEINANLSGYKHITSIWPQGRLDTSSAPISFSFGVTDYPSVPPVFSIPQTYDAAENYQCDFTDGGRFLSITMTYPDYKAMRLSGFDIEVDVTGDR